MCFVRQHPYGEELNDKFHNIDKGNIQKLTSRYPSHSFVIDRKTASTLFKNVREPSDAETQLESALRTLTSNFSNIAGRIDPLAVDLRDILDKLTDSEPLYPPDDTQDNNEHSPT